MSLVLGGLFHFFSGPHSLQYKAERLGWSGSLLLQTEAALISDYGREQINYSYVLYMTPLKKKKKKKNYPFKATSAENPVSHR